MVEFIDVGNAFENPHDPQAKNRKRSIGFILNAQGGPGYRTDEVPDEDADFKTRTNKWRDPENRADPKNRLNANEDARKLADEAERRRKGGDDTSDGKAAGADNNRIKATEHFKTLGLTTLDEIDGEKDGLAGDSARYNAHATFFNTLDAYKNNPVQAAIESISRDYPDLGRKIQNDPWIQKKSQVFEERLHDGKVLKFFRGMTPFAQNAKDIKLSHTPLDISAWRNRYTNWELGILHEHLKRPTHELTFKDRAPIRIGPRSINKDQIKKQYKEYDQKLNDDVTKAERNVARTTDKIAEGLEKASIHPDLIDALNKSGNPYAQVLGMHYEARMNGTPMTEQEIITKIKDELRAHGNGQPRLNTEDFGKAIVEAGEKFGGYSGSHLSSAGMTMNKAGARLDDWQNSTKLSLTNTKTLAGKLDTFGLGVGDVALAIGAGVVGTMTYKAGQDAASDKWEHGVDSGINFLPFGAAYAANAEDDQSAGHNDKASTDGSDNATETTDASLDLGLVPGAKAAPPDSDTNNTKPVAARDDEDNEQQRDPEVTVSSWQDGITMGGMALAPITGLGSIPVSIGLADVTRLGFRYGGWDVAPSMAEQGISSIATKEMKNTDLGEHNAIGLGEHVDKTGFIELLKDGHAFGRTLNAEKLGDFAFENGEAALNYTGLILSNPDKAVNQAVDTADHYWDNYGYPLLHKGIDILEWEASFLHDVYKTVDRNADEIAEDAGDFIDDAGETIHYVVTEPEKALPEFVEMANRTAHEAGEWWTASVDGVTHAAKNPQEVVFNPVGEFLTTSYDKTVDTLDILRDWIVNIATSDAAYEAYDYAGYIGLGALDVVGDVATTNPVEFAYDNREHIDDFIEHTFKLGTITIGTTAGVIQDFQTGFWSNVYNDTAQPETVTSGSTDSAPAPQASTSDNGWLSGLWGEIIGIDTANAATRSGQGRTADIRTALKSDEVSNNTNYRPTGISAAAEYGIGDNPIAERTKGSLSQKGDFTAATQPGAHQQSAPDTAPDLTPGAPAHAQPLLNLIARGESSVEAKGYDMVHGGNTRVYFDGEYRQLTEMTVGEVLDWQAQTDGHTAAGRYQFIDDTLARLVDKLGIDQNTQFDAALQNRLAMELLHERGYEQYLNGEMSREAFLKEIAHEWASLPEDASGISAYKGVAGNEAHIAYSDITSGLNESYRVANAQQPQPSRLEMQVPGGRRYTSIDEVEQARANGRIDTDMAERLKEAIALRDPAYNPNDVQAGMKQSQLLAEAKAILNDQHVDAKTALVNGQNLRDPGVFRQAYHNVKDSQDLPESAKQAVLARLETFATYERFRESDQGPRHETVQERTVEFVPTA